MEDQTQSPLREQTRSNGLGDPLAPNHAMATVAAGPYSEQLPVANYTVGQIRARLGPRFDIDPQSQAVLDGRDVGDEEIVRAGQLLLFAHRVGEKGALVRSDRAASAGTPQVLIEGVTAHTRTPEGNKKSMPLAGLLDQIVPRAIGTGEMVLPDGAKALLSHGRLLLCVQQIPPRVHNLKWLCADSARPYGRGATYRTVRVALPYLVLMELFGPAPGGRLTLLNHSECFFRSQPLRTLDDPLHFPALLNCSKFDPPEGKPLAWICSQHLNRSFDQEPHEGLRLWKAHRELLHCLLETGFNLSSEHHEGNSWFNASRMIDPRLNTIEAWIEATRQDPLFVLDIPWLPTSLSVRGMAERMFQLHSRSAGESVDASRLARAIVNQP